MLNHKTIFKQKSKILLIILSIFGLAFSYSCSCRSGGDPTRVSGGAASGNYLLIVNSAGNDYNQMATISFANATATLKTVSDADGGNSGLTESDFVYDGKNLSLKAGATEKFDAETLKKVTTTRQTVVATFSLTANSGNVDLDATEKTVEIEVVKATKMEDTTASSTVANAIRTGGDIQIGHFNFNTARINQDAGYEENSGKGKLFNAHTSTVDDDLMPLSSFKNAVLKNIYTESKIEKAYFDGAPAEMGNTMISLKLKIVFKPEYEYTSSSGSSEYEYTLDAVAQSTEGDKKGDWNLQG